MKKILVSKASMDTILLGLQDLVLKEVGRRVWLEDNIPKRKDLIALSTSNIKRLERLTDKLRNQC